MSESCSLNKSYKLRCSQPVLVCSDNTQQCECAPGRRTTMVISSFGLDIINGRTIQATDNLPLSIDFIGISPDGTLESANFNATQYLTKDGDIVWNGQEIPPTQHELELEMPGIEVGNLGDLLGG